MRGAGDERGFLEGTLGDPRTPPESDGWRRVRELDPEAYRHLVDELVSEDLEVFFEHAYGEAGDQGRKLFWRTYVGAIRRTLCILEPSVYQQLKIKLSGADPRFKAALERAHRFRHKSDGQAFCLYFDRLVVVEFSRTGNAAYLYERDTFEREIEPLIRGGRLDRVADLKRRDAAFGRISHGGRWEENAESVLRRYGVARPLWRAAGREGA